MLFATVNYIDRDFFFSLSAKQSIFQTGNFLPSNQLYRLKNKQCREKIIMSRLPSDFSASELNSILYF